ncbi:MAG: GNAT family N-acetyltransferase [Pirellulales bacterium]|nr:GNAT family N-acetyltransferase [Pirellulales bacterium]
MAVPPPIPDAITRCPGACQRAALELVFESLPEHLRDSHVDALLAARGETPLDGLIARISATTIEAAVFVQPQAGGVASLWGPAVLPGYAGDKHTIIRALIELGCCWAREKEAELAQTLIGNDQAMLADFYRDEGFSIRADLVYMACGVVASLSNETRSELQLVPCRARGEEPVSSIIAQTYQGTRDCPELNGLRDMQHVLEGYTDAGDSGDEYWYLVCRSGQTVGVLLLADHASQDQIELVYLGVLPAERGRGYGETITRHALREARRLGRSRVVLAVDARNRPAIDIYERVGFTTFDRRTALLKSLRDV